MGTNYRNNYDDSFDDQDFYDGYEPTEEGGDDIDEEVCQHIDEDGDGFCDICGEPMESEKKVIKTEGFVNDIVKTESEKNDWEKFGFDKKYEGDFDINHALTLFYKVDDDTCQSDVAAQMEAIKYATYFAKKGSDEAKTFIVMEVIQKKEMCAADSVYEMAYVSFSLFFRNYLRKVSESYIQKNHDDFNPTQFAEMREECLSVLWEYVISRIHEYNGEYKLNTFFKEAYLKGALADHEAQSRGKKYKNIQYFDAKVANMRKALIEQGNVPTPYLVATLLEASVESVETSFRRIEIENTAVSLDDDLTRASISETREQETFISPEKALLKEEKMANLLTEMGNIDPKKARALMLSYGLDWSEDGKTWVQLGEDLKESEIAKIMGVSTDDVKALIHGALIDLRNTKFVGGKNKADKVLNGRSFVFTDDDEEAELRDLIADIEDFSDF